MKFVPGQIWRDPMGRLYYVTATGINLGETYVEVEDENGVIKIRTPKWFKVCTLERNAT